MSHEMMHAAPADSGTPMMGPSATNSPTGAMPMLPISPANTAFSGTTSSIPVSAPQPSGLNSLPARVVQIHSSGAYQPPQSRSVSYGQPLGFDSQSSTPLNQIPNPPSGGNLTSASADSPPPVYLEGLNAGPGAIFPVSVSDPQAKQPSSSAMSGTGTTGLNMNNISSPGTNSVVNGAMYEQSGSALPSQDWANQQQQQLRAQQLQSQRWLEQQSMGRRPVTPPPKDSASWGAGSYNSNPGAWPASRAQAINPLEAYEKQRQQLDSEYNRTLQQLDRQNSPAMPQF